MGWRAKMFLIFAAVLVAVFLLGFLPEYYHARNLQQQLQTNRQQLAFCRVYTLAGELFLQTSMKNYGQASRSATEFFGAARELAARTPSPDVRQTMESVLAKRDVITAQLARGDDASYGSVQTVFQNLSAQALNSVPSAGG